LGTARLEGSISTTQSSGWVLSEKMKITYDEFMVTSHFIHDLGASIKPSRQKPSLGIKDRVGKNTPRLQV